MKKQLTKMILMIVIIVLSSNMMAQVAVYDTVSIHDIQFVPNPDSSQFSFYLGDTITVKGFIRHGPRELWIGARWACHVTEDLNDPPDAWSGFFVLQNDSTEINTLFSYVQEGDEVYFTGVLDTYTGLTQLAILTDPVVPVTFVSSGNQLPGPVTVTLADIVTHADGEQWEAQYIRIENCTVTNNDYSGGQAVITDGTATGYVDDYFMYFRAQNDNNLLPWPANGTTINIQGYVRDIGQDYFTINPRDTNDFEILSNPPVISDITRDIGVPGSIEEVIISANITDNGVVDSAVLHYSIDWGAFNEIKMNVARTIYSANIPAQANNSFIRYFISAVDDAGDVSQMPGDTTERIYYYIVKDGDISIKDVQYTWGYNYDGSGMRGFEVTLEGVVITDTLDWTNNFYIQEKDSMWSGIWVYDDSVRPNKGDWVRITGTVEENYGVTRINDLTDFQVITEGYGVPEPVTVSTFEISTAVDNNGEAYESVLIQVLNVTVSNPFPDGSINYGEFEINDGSGGVRVDDAMSSFDGNLDSTYKADHTIEKLIGLGYYSYGDYKMLPRGDDDIIGHVTAVEDEQHIVNKYHLNQNFPNPFNNETTIRFAVASSDPVTLTIYNILGQPIRNLYWGAIIPGNYDISWNGRDNGGKTVSTGIYFYKLEGQDFSSTKKMLFIK